MTTTIPQTRTIYAVLATSLHGEPFRSRRGEYLDRVDALAHKNRWESNGDKAVILTETETRPMQAFTRLPLSYRTLMPPLD